MIRYLQNMKRPGAAVFVSCHPPEGTYRVRVCRRYDDAFADVPEAEDGFVVNDSALTGALDWRGVIPGVEHWYAAFYLGPDGWTRSEPKAVTPTAETHAPYIDSLDVIRERVEIGLRALVDADILTHPRGHFAVLTAPPQFEDIIFPAVAVQLDQASPEEQFVGGFLGEELLDDGDIRDFSGWRSRYTVEIGAWSLNPDERRLLRRSLRDIIIANRDVFDVLGLQELTVSMSDSEDFQSYASPLYMSVLRCMYAAPDIIHSDSGAIADIPISIDADMS